MAWWIAICGGPTCTLKAMLCLVPCCRGDPGPIPSRRARDSGPPSHEGERTMPNTVLYASVGADLIHFDIDVAAATLTRRGTVSVPANVQYVWPHASRRFLYAASSDSASGMGKAG